VGDEDLVELIAAELFRHRLTLGEDGRPQCACGWWVAPLLDSLHRLHQAEALSSVVTART
jgi:hypothetical protein